MAFLAEVDHFKRLLVGDDDSFPMLMSFSDGLCFARNFQSLRRIGRFSSVSA